MSARISDTGITSDYRAMNARFCGIGEAGVH